MAEFTFPNVSFESRILGPAPASPSWRDGYAIIGEFNRGPLTPVSSQYRSVLATLLGEDSSPGSIALQQALQQGATNAHAIRVIPSTQPGKLKFYVAGENINVAPKTGYESAVSATNVLDAFNRTTGLRLTLDYIGSPLSSVTHYGEIRTEPGRVTHDSFFGRGQMNFVAHHNQKGNMAEPLVYEDDSKSLSINLRNSGPEEYQIVTYTEGSDPYVELYLKQGFSLVSTEYGQSGDLAIVSNPFYINADTGLMGMVVKGHYSPSTTITGVVDDVPGLREVVLEVTFGAAGADWEPTADQLSILEDAFFLVGGTAYLIESASADDNEVTLELKKNLNSAVEEGIRGVIVPQVGQLAAVSGGLNVTLKGLATNSVVVGTKLTFSTSGKTLEVAEVVTPYNAQTGVVVVNVTGATSDDIKVRDFVSVTAPNLAVITKDFQVHFPRISKMLVGYRYQPIDDFAALKAQEAGMRYFLVSDNTTDYDAFIALDEGSGARPIEFKYLVAPNSVTGPVLLKTEGFGAKVIYGRPNDPRLSMKVGTDWTIPFARTQVVVGGRAGTPEAYAKGTPVMNILRDLEYAIYNDPVFAGMTASINNSISTTPYKFEVTPSFSGLESNRIKWNLVRYVAGPELVFSSYDSPEFNVENVVKPVRDKYADYGVTFNGTYYPLSDADPTSVEFDMPNDVRAAFADSLVVGDVIQLESQSQTRDMLISLERDGQYGHTAYGADKFYRYKGGRDTSTYAYRDFYSLEGRPLVRVQALNPGSYGNNLRISIIPDEVSEGSARFYLQVEDTSEGVSLGGSKIESYYLDNKSVDINTGAYIETMNSNLVRVYLIPAVEPPNPSIRAAQLTPEVLTALPLRLAPALEGQDLSYANGLTRFSAQGSEIISNVALTRGSDFVLDDEMSTTEARVSGYLDALDKVAALNVTWIGVVGIYQGDPAYKRVFDKLKQIVDNSGPASGGFRRAVVQLPPNATPRLAANLRNQIDSPRFIQIAGVCQGTSMAGIRYRNESVVGAYIGLGASRGPHHSPASVYGDRSVVGMTYSSINPSNAILEGFTQAGTEVFFRDPGLNVFKFLNGRSTTTNRLLRHVSVVHAWDQARDKIYLSLLSYRSQNITEQLRSRIASACDAILADFLREEMLSNYQPTICDARNNTELDALNGIINITIQASPVIPGDYLRVTDILDFRSVISLNVRSGAGSVS